MGVSRLLRQVFASIWHSHGEQLDPSMGSAQLAATFKRLLENLPENWPRLVDLQRVAEVIQDDGLPLVWVPPPDVVAAILAAPDRNARVAAMLDHADELMRDCRRILAELDAERLIAQLPLAP